MKLKITVDGKDYEVEVEVLDAPTAPVVGVPRLASAGGGAAAAPRAAAAPAPAADDSVADEAKAIRSPIAGNVSKVHVEPGQTVAANETVIILEAMKMETSITSPIDGTVKSVRVAAGDAVKLQQVLLEFE